ncbi:hypothetical protein [Agarivorans sp. Toyoura001]|uniref:Imm32 family immunity protein n=1 Tax=unclassified Agarivorans TaxID=2636026 RepID=UPI0010F1488E|nr:hypothetical protein [Agarivorans sp. Toyoura001]GDY26850.1 hypothetical protein AHAT_27400 [Agarivorans sp. Toyoura001]
MKVYGYSKSIEGNSPLILSEITLSTNAKELREIAKFLEQAANKMDRNGSGFEHLHLSDFSTSIEGPDLIIFDEPTLK